MSRRVMLADAVRQSLAGWGSLPSGVVVQRVRNITTLVKDLPSDAPAVIAVICASMEDESTRGEVAESVTVGIVLMANCASQSVSDTDQWDEFTELLTDHLRTDSALQLIDVGNGRKASRKAVATSVICDADLLNANDVFISVTEATWFMSVSNR